MKTNYANTSMLDMVFENRNKAYGAYVLRRDHDKFLLEGFFFTIAFISSLLLYNFLYEKFHQVTQQRTIGTIITCANIDTKQKVIPKAVQPSKPAARPKATIANTEKRIVANSHVRTDSIPKTKDIASLESGISTNTNATDGPGLTDGTGNLATFDVIASAKPEIDNSIHDFSEIPPEFPGGEKKLLEFLQRHTEYPSIEQNMELQGKAIVKFVVNEDGTVSDAEVVNADSRGFGKEAMRVVSLLPKFKPGKQSGRAVKVRYVLPFFFKLNN